MCDTRRGGQRCWLRRRRSAGRGRPQLSSCVNLNGGPAHRRRQAGRQAGSLAPSQSTIPLSTKSDLVLAITLLLSSSLVTIQNHPLHRSQLSQCTSNSAHATAIVRGDGPGCLTRTPYRTFPFTFLRFRLPGSRSSHKNMQRPGKKLATIASA